MQVGCPHNSWRILITSHAQQIQAQGRVPEEFFGRAHPTTLVILAFIMLSSHRLETQAVARQAFGFLLQTAKHLRSHRYGAW
jgi:hypothetical protein